MSSGLGWSVTRLTGRWGGRGPRPVSLRFLRRRTVVIRDPAEMWSRLRAGEGDVAAARLLRTVVDEKDVAFTNELYLTRPALL